MHVHSGLTVRANTEVEARKNKEKVAKLQLEWLRWWSDKLTIASPDSLMQGLSTIL